LGVIPKPFRNVLLPTDKCHVLKFRADRFRGVDGIDCNKSTYVKMNVCMYVVNIVNINEHLNNNLTYFVLRSCMATVACCRVIFLFSYFENTTKLLWLCKTDAVTI